MKAKFWLGTALSLSVLGCADNPAGTHSANRYGIPNTIALEMPATLKTVSAYRTQAQLVTLSQQLKGNVDVYTNSTQLVDAILGAVIKLDLTPGKSYTFKGADGKAMTVLLETKADHSVVSIGMGESATGSSQVLGISFTSKTKGRAVFKPSEVIPSVGKLVLATTFDLDAGRVSADGFADGTALADGQQAQKLRAHWEFASYGDAPAASPSFTVKVSAFTHKASDANGTGVYALSANCLKAGGAAAIIGMQTGATANAFTWIPSTDPPSFAEPLVKGFFLDGNGEDLLPDQATEVLKAVVPADDSIYRPFPADPTQTEPLSDPIFQFPQ